jgi:hypothetical protein
VIGTGGDVFGLYGSDGADGPGTGGGEVDGFDPFAPAVREPAGDVVPFGGGTVGGGDGFGEGFGDGFGGLPDTDVSGAGGLAPADRDLSGSAPFGAAGDQRALHDRDAQHDQDALHDRDDRAAQPGPRDPYGPRGGGAAGGATGSFDAFAAGAVASNDRLPALRPGNTPSLFDATAPLPKVTRPVRDPLAPEVGSGSGGNTKVERVVTAGYLLTVNHIDGTEVTACPPEEIRVPVRRTKEERAARITGARPTPPPGPPGPELPLLERDEERERLIRLLARGRSVRVTGPSGSGRTALLESVANAAGDLAPDGVLWLSGYHRTVADVLQDLYAVVYAGDGYRPARAELPGLLGRIGAVVVVDDLEFGGAALEELLDAAPECAFVVSATPEVPAPDAESMVEEVFLPGLTRVASMDLLQFAVGRTLAEDEAAWAADLWFESEGLPLRFVQAGALLRQRDALRAPSAPAAGAQAAEAADWDDSVWEKGSPAVPAGLDGSGAPAGPVRVPGLFVPLPSLAESAAPADLLASRLSEAAREALAFAVALDGECPHPSHLPALVGDTHGDAALSELTSVGLAVPVAAHFRLAAGVVAQLAPSLSVDGELSDVQAHTAALHYAWWTGHPSVTPERATAEAEAIIAAMIACRDGGHPGATVLLARTVAPAFAAALHWGAWERALRVGQEAARLSGEVAEEAYFLHELGVLALCTGRLERARADLEASIALRAALADRQGTVVGRRTLALVTDLAGAAAPEVPAEAAPEPPVATTSGATPFLPEPATVVIGRPAVPAAAPVTAAPPTEPSARRLAVVGSRRNLVAAGTGVVIAAVVGTIVTLGATSGGGDTPANQVKPIESAQQVPPATTTTPAENPTTTSPSGKPSSSAPSSTAATPSTTATVAGGALSSPPPNTPSTSPSKTQGGGGHKPPGGSSGGTTGGSTGSTSTGGSSGSPTGGSTGSTTTGGSTGTPTGGSTGSTTTGGSTGTPTGGSTGSTTTGGSTGTPTGGSTGSTTTGGSTGTPTGGSTGSTDGTSG